MTDQPHSARAHPSPDELADLRADALGADRSAEIAAHVVICGSCTDELAAMDEVEILLSEAGREPVPMPADVAASLDAALARVSREREAGVSSLEDKRAERSPAAQTTGGRGRMSKIIPALGAAAAVFVIAGVAFNLGTNRDAEDSMTAGDGAASDQQPESAPSGAGAGADRPGSKPGKNAPDHDAYRVAPQKITRQNLGTYAFALAAAPTSAVLDNGTESTPPADRICPPVLLSDTRRRTPVQFEGELAYVVVKTEAREATVYTCESPPERLYSTSY